MLALRTLLVVTCAGLAIHCHAPAPVAAPGGADVLDEDARAGVAYLNRVRKAAGLYGVELDPVMSRKAELHARYLQINAGRPELDGLRAHHEVPSLPGYTADGAEAGVASVIAFAHEHAPDAIDAWLSTLYHRTPILRRDLLRIGIGRAGAIHVLMVDGEHSPAIQPPVLFPIPSQRDVPSRFSLGEVPEPRPAAWFGTLWADATAMRSGYPVTVAFDRSASITEVRATLADERGPVEVATSSPQAPATGFPQGAVVAMLPRHPLAPGTRYRATVEYRDRGVPGALRWEFRTADPVRFDATRPGAPVPPAGTPVEVEGVVEFASVHSLCEEGFKRCKPRISVELERPGGGSIATKLEIVDGATDADRALGMIGRRVRARGFAEYPIAGLLEVQLPSAASVEVTGEGPPRVSAEAVGSQSVGKFLAVTGTMAIVAPTDDRPLYLPLSPSGAQGPVFVYVGAKVWATVLDKLSGKWGRTQVPDKRAAAQATKRVYVRVRGKVSRGGPTGDGFAILVSHPAQVELE